MPSSVTTAADENGLVGAGIGDRALDFPDARLVSVESTRRVVAEIDLALPVKTDTCDRPQSSIDAQIVLTGRAMVTVVSVAGLAQNNSVSLVMKIVSPSEAKV